eukprot:COSAG04_NODE_2447_length_4104_cov_2.484894_5_plen_70_part_00
MSFAFYFTQLLKLTQSLLLNSMYVNTSDGAFRVLWTLKVDSAEYRDNTLNTDPLMASEGTRYGGHIDEV